MGDISVSMAWTSLTLDHGRGSLTASAISAFAVVLLVYTLARGG